MIATPTAFSYDVRSPRVIFGHGARDRLLEVLTDLGVRRVLLISTPGRTRALGDLRSALEPRLGGIFDQAQQHVPSATVVSARAAAESAGVDGYLSVGGGSATGLAKALALESGLPIVAIPTTYSGSEMTPIWGITDGARKVTGRDARVLPRAVIYDPELTADLPRGVAGVSGMNAVAHCVEAIYAPDANPVTTLLAEEGIRVLAGALPAITRGGDALDARSAALYGAFLGGTTLASVTMGIHHRLCHILGGAFALPHAETHAVMLPHVVAWKARTDERVERVRLALGGGPAGAALRRLADAVKAPGSLREIGFSESALPQAVELAAALEDSDGNLLGEVHARSLLVAALRGEPPHARETLTEKAE